MAKIAGALAAALSALLAVLLACLLGAGGGIVGGGLDYLPWHEGPRWDRLLSIYDEAATAQFGSSSSLQPCSSKVVETSYGPTQVHACGDPSKTPVLFLHGAGSNSLIYGDWLMPSVVSGGMYAIAADFVCDCGRSAPADGDPAKCPGDREGLARWVEQVLAGSVGLSPSESSSSGSGVGRKASIVGYSYGSTVAAFTALHRPHLVDKLVLIAPAAVFAPVQFGWIWRAIVYGLTRTPRSHSWFFRYMSAEPDFDMERDMTAEDLNLTVAIRELGATVLAVQADALDEEELRRMAWRHPTLLLIGEEETVVDARAAAEVAERAGVTVKVYSNAGHLLLMESPREQSKVDVVSFLSGKGP